MLENHGPRITCSPVPVSSRAGSLSGPAWFRSRIIDELGIWRRDVSQIVILHNRAAIAGCHLEYEAPTGEKVRRVNEMETMQLRGC